MKDLFPFGLYRTSTSSVKHRNKTQHCGETKFNGDLKPEHKKLTNRTSWTRPQIFIIKHQLFEAGWGENRNLVGGPIYRRVTEDGRLLFILGVNKYAWSLPQNIPFLLIINWYLFFLFLDNNICFIEEWRNNISELSLNAPHK